VQESAWAAVFFLGLYVAGFGWVGTLSIAHLRPGEPSVASETPPESCRS
jgi:hypothetical protein